MTIWLLRHAESEWNAAGRWQGHGDPPLSARGRAEAKARAPEIAVRLGAGSRPIRVLSSDLRRAVETAAFVAYELDVAPSISPNLRELDVGTWTGLERHEIEAADAKLLAAFESDDPDVRPGGARPAARSEFGCALRRSGSPLRTTMRTFFLLSTSGSCAR